MGDRNPEGFRRLPCQCASAGIRNGTGGHDGNPEPQFFKMFFNREESRLQIERIKCRLNEQKIDTAFDERSDLSLIRLFYLSPSHIAFTGIMDITRNGESSIQR